MNLTLGESLLAIKLCLITIQSWPHPHPFPKWREKSRRKDCKTQTSSC